MRLSQAAARALAATSGGARVDVGVACLTGGTSAIVGAKALAAVPGLATPAARSGVDPATVAPRLGPRF